MHKTKHQLFITFQNKMQISLVNKKMQLNHIQKTNYKFLKCS